MTQFNKNGTRSISFTLYKSDVARLRKEWKGYAASIAPYSDTFKGKGIVICAGGLSYYTCCHMLIHSIRRSGCKLPVEVWYMGNEISVEGRAALEAQGVTCCNFLDYDNTSLAGWMLKPLAILKSSFREVLYLDADNICCSNPEVLFLSQEYLRTGALFWPDYWKTASENPIWDIIGCSDFDMKEQESGQLLIHKEKCWRALNLCLYFNSMHQIYYKLLWGDKDTFRFAWIATKTPFYMISVEPAACGYDDIRGRFLGTTMIQHNINGEFLFLHRNLLKWDITRTDEYSWKKIKRFRATTVQCEYSFDYSDNGHYYMDLQGDTEELLFADYFGDVESEYLSHLERLRSSPFYSRLMLYSHFARCRYPVHKSFDIPVASVLELSGLSTAGSD